MPPTSVGAGGGSTSGTPGTLVAELDAMPGHLLAGIFGWVYQPAATDTQTRVIVTFDDASTVAFDLPPSALAQAAITDGGVCRTDIASAAPVVFARPVRKVRVETLGTGVGARRAILGAARVMEAA